MDPRIDSAINDWPAVSSTAGYAGLHELADADFSGVVTSNGTRGFMVNGRLVGIDGGSIEAFQSTNLSARKAEDAALPLLCAMLIADAETEAEYYSGETPIQEVDQTLSASSFTGYLELSENVFSGDYFVLYYGGTSRSVAFLGSEERVITGGEAFERANDEVGIYEVNSVNIGVIDIPEPDVARPASTTTSQAPPSGDNGGADVQDEVAIEQVEKPTSTDREDEPVSVERSGVETTPESALPDQGTSGASETADPITLAERAMRDSAGFDSGLAGADDEGESLNPDEWVTIPALDPSRSTLVAAPTPESTETIDEESAIPSDDGVEQSDPAASASASEAELETVRTELAETERENARLRERIEELEDQLASDAGGIDSTARDTLTSIQALDGTNLFVRYRSKADSTLADAMTSADDAATVQDNLRLEWHTTFDEEALVDGLPYPEFIQATFEYRFATWMLGELLFELRDTGRDSSLQGLFEAIPEIDRIEINGTIPIHIEDGGERENEAFSFDMVFRNSMGDPLLVVAVHDDRAPAGTEPVARLIEDADRVASARTGLHAALFVTRSYYEPDALETVSDATSGSFLGRNTKDSYVRVSRKHGFHVCLIEARNETFHLTMPEL